MEQYFFFTSCTNKDEINKPKTEIVKSSITNETKKDLSVTTDLIESKENSTETFTSELPLQQIEKTLTDNVLVMASVNMPKETTLNKYINIKNETNLDSLAQIFLVNTDDIVDRQEYDSQEGKSIYIETESGNTVFVADAGTIDFSSKNAELFREYNTATLRETNKEVLLIQEHTYQSRLEIETEFLAILNSLNVDTDRIQIQFETYAIDYQFLFQEQERIKNDPAFKDFVDMGKAQMKDNWSEEDNIYYSEIIGYIDGIKISNSFFELQDMRFIAPALEAELLVSKESIEGIRVYNALGTLQVQESGEIISVEKILDSLEEKFTNIIVPVETKFENFSLEYINIPNKDGNGHMLTPVWIASGYENVEIEAGEHMKFPYNIYFDALTGAEIR